MDNAFTKMLVCIKCDATGTNENPVGNYLGRGNSICHNCVKEIYATIIKYESHKRTVMKDPDLPDTRGGE